MIQQSSLRQATFAAKPMSRLDAELIAEGILRKMYPQNLETPARLNVEKMLDDLEPHFGVILAVEDIPSGEEAFVDFENAQIVMDAGVYELLVAGDGRARSTACHEIGHLPHIDQVRAMIREGGPVLARRVNVTVPPFRDPEWQAYAIGSALLMPRRTVPEVYARGGVDEVVKFYQVSRQAAEVRIRVLRQLRVVA